MEIQVIRDKEMAGYNTGGGLREVKAVIFIDDSLHPRTKRHIAIYETLGCCLDYVLSHNRLENLADTLLDVLDQLEPIGLEK